MKALFLSFALLLILIDATFAQLQLGSKEELSNEFSIAHEVFLLESNKESTNIYQIIAEPTLISLEKWKGIDKVNPLDEFTWFKITVTNTFKIPTT